MHFCALNYAFSYSKIRTHFQFKKQIQWNPLNGIQWFFASANLNETNFQIFVFHGKQYVSQFSQVESV